MSISETAEEKRNRLIQAKLELPRLAEIHSLFVERHQAYCEQVPTHKHRETVFDPYCTRAGVIEYDSKVYVRYRDADEQSELRFAHELMHYILVLEGATLPSPLEGDVPDSVRYLRDWLMKGVTHHPLVTLRLSGHGYDDDMSADSLPLEELTAEPMTWPGPGCRRNWLLSRINQRLFVTDGAADGILRPLAEQEGLCDLYDRICASPPNANQIEYINELSQQVIHTYELDKQLEMVGLDEYITRKIEADA